MANSKPKKLSFFTLAFLILAVIFLAIGMGTLGSVQGVGKSYELLSKDANNNEFAVIFQLNNIEKTKKDKTKETVKLRLREVYLNVAVIYSDLGTDAEIVLNRGSKSQADGGSTFSTGSSYRYTATLANLRPASVEEGKTSTAIPDAVGNWIAPFTGKFADSSSYDSDATYRYYKLTATNYNLLINEVVFVGEVLNGSEGTGEMRVIPATVYKATMLPNETTERAIKRAGVLLDAQRMPNTAQSSFNRLGGDELYTMMSVAEMRTGNTYNEKNIYHGDKIYNSFGTSLVAFGTVIFGMSPFGLRFFPMLASFGVLVVGFFLAKSLFKSDKAGFAFALVYALCNFSFGLGHLGTPLMIGVFFFLASFYACWLFFENGMNRGGFKDSVPLILSGLCGAAAICTNGAFLIPVAGVVGLFVAGLVRRIKEGRAELDAAIALAEEEEAAPGKAEPVAEAAEERPLTGKEKVVKVLGENRRKTAVASASFFTSLVLGGLILSLLFLIPVYFTAVKLFDNPASPSVNVFSLMANLFAGGFTGANPLSSSSFTALGYALFRGTGELYAFTNIFMNPVAMLIGLAGIAFFGYRIAEVCKSKGSVLELVNVIVPFAGMILCLVVSFFAKGALAFALAAYCCAFLLAAGGVKEITEKEGKAGKVAKIIWITAIALLGVCFLLSAVFTFSIPLPAAFVSKF